ncbi:MAG: TolC family protein, partial [Bryobacteraceae bacterium]
AFNFPIYSFGLRLNLPLRDRAARANMADALIAKRRDTLQARNVEQQIRLDVLNAVNQVESSKEGVTLAIKARDFAQESLNAETKKYELGTSQIFIVLQQQTNLIGAEADVVNQAVGYRQALVNMLRMTGELLDERGVTVQ